MPYAIRKGGGSCKPGQWAVVNKQTGKSVGCHSTEASAKKQLAALAINVMSKEALVSKQVRETTPLGEATKATPSGRMRVHAITAGLGSSGYYSPEVLREAADKQLISPGTPLFLDHPSETDRHDRPERSVRDIAAVFINEAAYDDREQALVGDIQVFAPYRELLTEMAPHIGLSIHGSATDIVEGEVDGKRVPMIEGLAAIDSVDFVTRAGRGGKFVALLESARAAAERDITEVPATRPDSTTTTTEGSKEDTMGKIEIDEAEHQRLVEAAGRVDTLEAERDTEKARADKAEQDLAAKVAEAAEKNRPKSPRDVMEARDKDKDHRIAVLEAKDAARNIVEEELASAWLPPSTIGRLRTQLMSDLPMVENKLDETALRNRAVEIRTQHELEAAETLEAAGVGAPRGLSAQRPTAEGDVARLDAQITESLQNAFGLSETEAAAAVKGR